LKAKKDLPSRLDELRSRLSVPVTDEELPELTRLLHKLRGLVSNFMTEKDSIPKLILCEQMVESRTLAELPAHWKRFEEALLLEVDNLESWLRAEGFSCE